MSLHRPSPLLPRVPSHFILLLREAAAISVDLYYWYSASNRVTVNWVHLFQIYGSCVTLVFCLCEMAIRPDLPNVLPAEVEVRLVEYKDCV